MEANTRNELADWILHLQDEELLSTLVLIKESTEEDWYTTLTETQKDSVQRGIKDHENGRTLSSNDFWKKHDPK